MIWFRDGTQVLRWRRADVEKQKTKQKCKHPHMLIHVTAACKWRSSRAASFENPRGHWKVCNAQIRCAAACFWQQQVQTPNSCKRTMVLWLLIALTVTDAGGKYAKDSWMCHGGSVSTGDTRFVSPHTTFSLENTSLSNHPFVCQIKLQLGLQGPL